MAVAAALARSPRPIVERVVVGATDERLVARVRAGDDAAFEAIYDRYHHGLLAFCRHMVGSREEAEDVLQHSLVSAYRALRAGTDDIRLKPWLYTIARNRCLSTLRARREQIAMHGDAMGVDEPCYDGLAAQVQRRADLRDLVQDMQRLPEQQRAALVLFELGDHSHEEIAAVLNVRTEKVKALVFQAREGLLRARRARDTPCTEIREQLASLTGRALRRGAIRGHVEGCRSCAAFEVEVRHQRSALAMVIPVVPALGLKASVLGSAFGGGVAAVTSVGAGAGGAGVAVAGGAGASSVGLTSVGAGTAATGLAGAGATAGAGVGVGVSATAGSVASAVAGLGANGVVVKILTAVAVAGGAGGAGYVSSHDQPPAPPAAIEQTVHAPVASTSTTAGPPAPPAPHALASLPPDVSAPLDTAATPESAGPPEALAPAAIPSSDPSVGPVPAPPGLVVEPATPILEPDPTAILDPTATDATTTPAPPSGTTDPAAPTTTGPTAPPLGTTDPAAPTVTDPTAPAPTDPTAPPATDPATPQGTTTDPGTAGTTTAPGPSGTTTNPGTSGTTTEPAEPDPSAPPA